MKTDIKNKIQAIIEQYSTITKALLNDIKELEADQVYSADYRQDKIRQVQALMKETDGKFNAQLVELLQGIIQDINGISLNKPADYQAQISNALEFIKMSGEGLTDEQAFEIITPFLGDYRTMRLFRNVFANRSGNTCNVTLFMLSRFDAIIAKLEELADLAKQFFNCGSYAVNSLGFTIRTNMVLGEAEAIDSMMDKLNDRLKLNFSEIEEDMEKEIQVELTAEE